MYSKYDEAQFHLRLTHELHGKLKQRAKMNNRSINAEIVAMLEEHLDRPAVVSGYRDEAERLADIASQEVQKLIFEKLAEHYRKK